MRMMTATLAAIAVSALVPPLEAGEINLRWQHVVGASGYRVYYGEAPQAYSGVVDVGPQNETRITDLEDCRPYYVAVKAYNAWGESEGFSNEVGGWPRPEVDAEAPLAMMQGSQLVLSIPGTNFQDGATVNFDSSRLPADMHGDPLLRLESVDVVSCREIQALATVEPMARGFRAMPIGDLELSFEVTNPDSVFGSGPVPLAVALNPTRLDIDRSDSTTRDRVDGKDLVWMSYSHGTTEGGERYNPDVDLNGDGAVDGEDLAHLAAGFGGCWTGSRWSSEACPGR